MGYTIKSEQDKYQIIDSSGLVVGEPYATHAAAEAHLRVLNGGIQKSYNPRRILRDIKAQIIALESLTEGDEQTTEASESDSDDIDAENLRNLIGDNTKSLNLSYAKSLRAEFAPDLLMVKSIGADEIRGYSHLWGSESLADLEIEYFTKSTNFWDDVLGKSPRPLTWDHAQDGDFKASPVVGQIVDFGDDEVGRWYIARLERSHKYRKAVDALIRAGRVGTSSDSAPQYVERVQTGKATWLKTWPFFAAALTDQPCEPRMLSDGSIEYLKSLGISLPDAPDMARQFEQMQYRHRLLKLKGD